MSSESTNNEIQVNIKGPSELKLQITISTDKTVQELKQAIAEKSDVAADRQRLIYSGRVLKDEDLLSVYKIQSSHTIHMVKGVAKGAGSGSGSSTGASSTSQPLPRMQTGQNPHDPLTQLNSHMGFGAMAGINPFADMGLNPNDPNMMQTMFNSPQFMQQMASMLSNPAIMDQVIAMNPQLAGMAPQIRQMFSSPMFREMISNPDTLRNMMNMAQMMQGSGMGGMGGMGMNPFGMGGGQASSFPAPGVPNTGSNQSSTTPSSESTNNSNNTSTTTPGAGTGGGGGAGAGAGGPMPMPFFNPWFGGPAAGAGTGTPGSGTGGEGQGQGAGQNPFAGNPFFNPEFMQQMQQMWGAGALGPGFGGLGAGGLGSPAAAAAGGDTRPPEERFQVQLQVRSPRSPCVVL
ncbi:ubiquitin-60S ribosomal protein L40 fusion protein, variant 3 [Coprinopsis cinerea AmutBmut pab1-1]|nr:ubiquitin-60S ribosomal protein L40 fusion protein, variant 3 [Coprinopsis cinerea AmutBmut pab1-1]